MKDVVDKRGYDDGANIGFTMTGMSNKHTTLLTPSPAQVVIREHIGTVLASCPGADAPMPPSIALAIEIVTLQATERVDAADSEETRVDIAYAVKAYSAADGRFLESFDVSGSASRVSAVDATFFIEEALNEALREVTAEFLVALSQLIDRHAS